MAAMTSAKCHHHRQREAAARCPDCGRCFCRECVTEHDGAVVCAACLQRRSQGRPLRRARWPAIRLALAGAAGLVAAWLLFLVVGRALLMLPSRFHEGTFWRGEAPGEEEGER